MQQINVTRLALLTSLTAIVTTGCESQDRRLAQYAQRATEQQARQNERIAEQSEAVARQSQEVAAAAHKLVEQDAAARRDLIQAQEKLQHDNRSERSSLDNQRQQLVEERKAAAQAAVRDPVIAQAIITAGIFLAALLPLLVTLYALRRLPERHPTDELLDDALLQGLIDESTGGRIDVLRQPLAQAGAPRLGGPEEPTAGNVPES